MLSDWTCIKLINKYPKRQEPVLICIPYRFMGKPYYHERRAEVRLAPCAALPRHSPSPSSSVSLPQRRLVPCATRRWRLS